jgi:hypothetical protein
LRIDFLMRNLLPLSVLVGKLPGSQSNVVGGVYLSSHVRLDQSAYRDIRSGPWRHGMIGEVPGQGDPLIPQPSLTLPALRQAVAAVAPGRLPEMFAKMQEAFVRAGDEDSVTPIHMFYREWAVVVEIERHPGLARRLHEAERTLMSDGAQVRDAAIREAGEIVRAAPRAVAGE